MYMAKDFPETVGAQFDTLSAVVDKLQERDETAGNMDGVLFWEGYQAAINGIRFNGLIILADHLERRVNHHYD